MKRHPFFDKSFVIRLAAADRIISSISTVGDAQPAEMLDVKADRVFVITSSAAHKIVEQLVSDPDRNERLAYGTGYRFANILTLDQFEVVETENRSRVHVDPDPESRMQVLEEFDRYGMALQVLIHSHPGRDACSVNPSSTDLHTLRNLEARYGAIGAICNAGGYLQFFSASQFFQLVVVGKGVEDHGLRHEPPGFRHLLRVCYVNANPVPAPKGGWLARIARGAAKGIYLV